MKADKASQTAQYMALFRALETTQPANKRLFKDPYAVSFLDGKLNWVARLSFLSFVRNYVQNTIHNKIPGALTSGIARTRYIDDLLQQTVQHNIQQVIILGAGFDTRALRLDYLSTIPVIEIDHPNTARKKTTILKKTLGQLPNHIHYWQLDFNKESLQELAVREKLDFSIPTTIIWEGVTNYLDAQAINNTFAFASQFATNSYIIFTYVHQQVLDAPESFFGAEKLLQDLDAIEERWTFGFDPEQLSAYLQQYNFVLLEDSGASNYRDKYLPNRPEKGYEFYRVAFAYKS
ncbi:MULTISPECIES: class I SAM-dependent methyltransferase [Niastella]|uniref:S-adenosyl-L-methionine-dependent methyltransferase n=1 Tax=Niastella soli TaxID=2821487 RepID=A0ABS3YSR7_9BACT|nr:SAM-dependent methyltransferase [Niastella soli]MBO9200930.1 SAM-dependent methyltransferase [Niastella soli]